MFAQVIGGSFEYIIVGIICISGLSFIKVVVFFSSYTYLVGDGWWYVLYLGAGF